MHHPTDRIIHTTAFVTPVMEHWLEREIAQWVHHMKDRSDDPSHHERTLLPQSYTKECSHSPVLQMPERSQVGLRMMPIDGLGMMPIDGSLGLFVIKPHLVLT